MLTLSGCEFELDIGQFSSTARAIHLLNKLISKFFAHLICSFHNITGTHTAPGRSSVCTCNIMKRADQVCQKFASGLRHAFKLLKYNVLQQLQFLGCFDFFDCTLHNMYTVCGKYQPVLP